MGFAHTLGPTHPFMPLRFLWMVPAWALVITTMITSAFPKIPTKTIKPNTKGTQIVVIVLIKQPGSAIYIRTVRSKLGFPTWQDFLVPQDKGTEVPSLSRDKGTTGQKSLLCPGTKGQAQNFAAERAGPIFWYLATGPAGTGFWQPVPSCPWISQGSHGTEGKKKKKN
jgi:hypothetical protein